MIRRQIKGPVACVCRSTFCKAMWESEAHPAFAVKLVLYDVQQVNSILLSGLPCSSTEGWDWLRPSQISPPALKVQDKESDTQGLPRSRRQSKQVRVGRCKTLGCRADRGTLQGTNRILSGPYMFSALRIELPGS